MTAVPPSSFSRCTTYPPGSGLASGLSHPSRPPPSACISTAHPGPAKKPPPPPRPLGLVSRTLTPPFSTEADTVHLLRENSTEPEKETLQSPSAHPVYLVPPPLGASVFFDALGFGAVFASRDSSSSSMGEEDAEGSASRALGREEARESVAMGAVSGLDHVAPEDDSALESQPAMAKTSSSAPIAVRFWEECGQCCMRGV